MIIVLIVVVKSLVGSSVVVVLSVVPSSSVLAIVSPLSSVVRVVIEAWHFIGDLWFRIDNSAVQPYLASVLASGILSVWRESPVTLDLDDCSIERGFIQYFDGIIGLFRSLVPIEWKEGRNWRIESNTRQKQSRKADIYSYPSPCRRSSHFQQRRSSRRAAPLWCSIWSCQHRP